MGVLLAGIERPRDEAPEALRSRVYREQGQVSQSPQLPWGKDCNRGNTERWKKQKWGRKTYPCRLCRSREHFQMIEG